MLNLDDIIQAIIEKNPKREFISTFDFPQILEEAPNGSSIGTASITYPNRQKYIIKESQPKAWQDIPVTPWEVANWIKKDLIEKYIKPTGRKKPHYNKRVYMELKEGRPWHYLKVVPGRYPNYVLIDIRAAFLSIYRQFSFSMFYYNYEDKIIFLQGPKIDNETIEFLEHNKRLRNALVGISGSTHRRVLVNHKIINMTTGGGNYSWALFILHFLQFVIYEIEQSCNVVYVGTDSVCVPVGQIATVQGILKRYNLQGRIEGQGEAHIISQGNYRVGKKQTFNYGRVDKEKANLLRLEHIDQRYKNFQRIIKKYI